MIWGVSVKMKKYLFTLLIIVFFAVSLCGYNKAFAKSDSKTRNNPKNKNELAAAARYYRGADGIWRLKNDLDLSSLCKRVKKELKYSADVLKMEDGSLKLNGIKSGCISIAASASDVLEMQKEKTATCMFVGDIMCLKGQQYAAEVKGGYDFKPSYSYVAKLFKTADFVCGNLETLLSESNPYTKTQVNAANGQPQCNGPKVLLDALRDAGFDMVVTANNHTCDWGSVGITETKTHLDEAGFANVGTHYNDQDPEKSGERFSIFDVNGIKVAVLSYTHIINQRGYLTSSQMSTMVHCFDREVVKADIADAREKGAEFIAVYCHWGIENTESLNSAQLEDSVYIANCGADLVIGSHPHCLQKCTYIKTDDGREVLCMFSMGNFCSSMGRDINNDTIILRVEIKKNLVDGKMVVRMDDASFIPCKVTTKDGHNCVVVPVEKDLNGGYRSDTLNAAGNRIRKIMNDVIREYKG